MSSDQYKTTFDAACAKAGGRSRVADLLGLTRGRIDQVARGEGVAQADWCAKLEQETEGAFVCEQINPDLPWARMADSAWPWHPQGRPVVDPTKSMDAAELSVAHP